MMSAEYFKLFYFQSDKQMWGFIIIIIAFKGSLAFIAQWGKKDKNLAAGVQIEKKEKIEGGKTSFHWYIHQ